MKATFLLNNNNLNKEMKKKKTISELNRPESTKYWEMPRANYPYQQVSLWLRTGEYISKPQIKRYTTYPPKNN